MSKDTAEQDSSKALLASGEQAPDLVLLSSIEATAVITPDEGEKEGRRAEERVGGKGEDFPRRRRLGSPEV